MPENSHNILKDLRGVGGLTIDAIGGVTDMVESLHQSISDKDVVGSESERMKGIAGLVYRNIHGVTDLVGGGMDTLLNHFGALMPDGTSSPGREAAISALNGILGDHLVAQNNPLAIPMQFRRDGKLLTPQMLTDIIQQSQNKLLIFVHGLCMNDLQWKQGETAYGAALASELGIIPIYLHYNTGLHISENGKQFSNLLEKTIAQLPQSTQIFVVAHSMGGLVSRSACRYGKAADRVWLTQLRKLVCLGTPHHGAPLEKGANWLALILQISPYSAPFSRLMKIRSNGITDLRYGNVVDDDWQGRDRFEFSGNPKEMVVPLPAGVDCYAVATTISEQATLIGDDLVGDGLVPVDSALGQHKEAELTLNFPETHQLLVRGTNHIDMLNNPEIYVAIKNWLISNP